MDPHTGFSYVDIVMDLCDGTLEDYLDDRTKYTKFDPLLIMKHCANGLHYLHNECTRTIIHKDIKPTNILLCNLDTKTKLADFGISRTLADDVTSFSNTHSCTEQWAAPEVLDMSSDTKVRPSVDIFSLGCVYYYLLTRKHPFDGALVTNSKLLTPKDFTKRKRHIINGDVCQFSKKITSYTVKDLIKTMIKRNPEMRYTSHEIKNHPTFLTSREKITFICQLKNKLHDQSGEKLLTELNKYKGAVS